VVVVVLLLVVVVVVLVRPYTHLPTQPTHPLIP
jgi:hypothetical protein